MLSRLCLGDRQHAVSWFGGAGKHVKVAGAMLSHGVEHRAVVRLPVMVAQHLQVFRAPPFSKLWEDQIDRLFVDGIEIQRPRRFRMKPRGGRIGKRCIWHRDAAADARRTEQFTPSTVNSATGSTPNVRDAVVAAKRSVRRPFCCATSKRTSSGRNMVVRFVVVSVRSDLPQSRVGDVVGFAQPSSRRRFRW